MPNLRRLSLQNNPIKTSGAKLIADIILSPINLNLKYI